MPIINGSFQQTDQVIGQIIGNGSSFEYPDNHNDLEGLQGGAIINETKQYYHLTEAEHEVVLNTSGENTGDQDLSGYLLLDQSLPQVFTNGIPQLSADRIILNDHDIVDKKHVADADALLLKLDQTNEETITGGVPKIEEDPTDPNHIMKMGFADSRYVKTDQTNSQTFTGGVPKVDPNVVVGSDENEIATVKFVNGYSMSSTGYAPNLYFSTLDSVVPGYKQMSYTLEPTETILTIPITTTEQLIRTYIHDADIGVSVIDGGAWSAIFKARVNASQGAYMRIEAFLRSMLGVETTLFSVTYDKIVNTTFLSLERQTNLHSTALRQIDSVSECMRRRH